MPYSDNLYSALTDESDLEPIGEPLTRYGDRGPVVTPRGPVTELEPVGSGAAAGDEDPHALSPTDGYFGTATAPLSGAAVPASSNMPYVPNVLVEDPSLHGREAEGKGKEAEQERLRNGRRLSNTDDGHTSGYSSMSPAQQRLGIRPQSVVATYYSPSSSTHDPPAATPSSSSMPYSSRGSAYHGEHFPFLPTEAPPAYTPSPSSPFNPAGLGDVSRNYSTFSQSTSAAVNMGYPDEAQGLLTNQPESMRDRIPGGLDDEELPTWRGRMTRMGRHVNQRSWRIALVSALLLLMTAGFLNTLLTGATDQNGRHNPAINKPKTKPNMHYPDIDGDFSWDAASTCKDAQIHRNKTIFDVSFGTDRQLTLAEKLDNDTDHHGGWRDVHVQGAVILRRAGSGTPNSSITLEITVTDERLDIVKQWDADAGTLLVTVPHSVEWNPDSPRACVNIKMTVWVPEDSNLKRLVVDATHLDVKLLDNLALSVTEGTKLASTVGTITSASTGSAARDDSLIDSAGGSIPASFAFHSRIIDVKTVSAPINGAWPLFDYLGLQTASGNIKVSVSPGEVDPDTLAPATLYVKSLSGDVSLREPIHAAEQTFRIGQTLPNAADRRRMEVQAETLLPPRDYRVDVHTTSGDILAAMAFSRSARIISMSGTLNLELLPVLDTSLAAVAQTKEVALQTTTTSGATDVTVLEPFWVEGVAVAAGEGEGAEGERQKKKAGYVAISKTIFALGDGNHGGEGQAPLRSLYSAHTTMSANIRLRYPGSWEGDISLSSLTGSLHAGGEGVKLIKAGSEWPGVKKILLARKGEKGMGGAIEAKSTSGGIDVLVGRKE